jgi:hypothetical protein
MKCKLALMIGTALVVVGNASATVSCSSGGTGSIRECNSVDSLVDIRTLAGWTVGLLLFLAVVGIFTRTFRG